MKKTSIAAFALIFLSLCSCNNKNNQSEEIPNNTAVNSQDTRSSMSYISKDTANKMIQSYLTSLGTDTTGNLQCLIADAGTLRNYLSDTSIKKIKVMFAHTLQYIDAGNGGQPAGYTPHEFTVLFAGFNAEGNYVLAPGGMVPDRAEPCPDNCITVGTAASPLIITN